MTHYWVTGCAGFIGSRVTGMLLRAGHVVTGIDNLNASYDPRMKQWRLARLMPRDGFRFHHVDICDGAALAGVMENGSGERPAAVIHLAASAGVRPSMRLPIEFIETNIAGTARLLELCRHHGIAKFVMASSSSVYGQSDNGLLSEDDDTSRPISPYAATKKSAEVICHAWHHLYGIDMSVLRFFTVYGPAGRPDMALFRFVQWISEGRPVTVFGDGRQERAFTFVDDIAIGVIAALAPVGYKIINLGSSQTIALMDAIHMLEEKLGRRAQLRFALAHPADVTASCADSHKAARLLQWSPQVSLDLGLQQLVDWYRENQSWASQLMTTATE